MNPLKMIDEWLADYASPRARRVVHAAIALVLIAAAIWQAAEENWTNVVPLLLTTLYAEANKANTLPLDPPGTPAGVNDLDYNLMGGLPFPETLDEQTEPLPIDEGDGSADYR